MNSNDWKISEQVKKIHRGILVWDMIFPYFDYYLFSYSMGGEMAGHFDPKYRTLQEYSKAGCDCVGLTVGGSLTNISMTMKTLATNRAYFTANRDKYIIVEKVDDIIRAHEQGKLAVVMNFQGSDALEGDADMVEIYYKLGIRSMLLTYNVRNAAGSGCHERTDDGLSNFGFKVVKEMNRVGMLVDASHTGYRTTMDIFDASEAPVVFTHSNPFSLTEHPRNIKDDQIMACARTGGVVGVVGFDAFLPGKVATVEALGDTIDYLVEKIGIEHVGLGLDWMYPEKMFREVLAINRTAYAKGHYETEANFIRPSELPKITENLLSRGYKEKDVRAIMGENWLRVTKLVWK